MTVAKYEAYFHELPRRATSILDTKYDRVSYFIRELRLLIYMDT